MSLFNPIEGRITSEKLFKILKEDALLQKSLGVQKSYTILTRTGIMMAGLIAALAVTPLDQALLGRIGIALLASVLACGWGANSLFHKIRLEETAESLKSILRENPHVTIEKDKSGILLKHKKFEARCSPISELQFQAMLEVETEVFQAMETEVKKAMTSIGTPTPNQTTQKGEKSKPLGKEKA